jgi:hypothetical protein
MFKATLQKMNLLALSNREFQETCFLLGPLRAALRLLNVYT